MFSTDLALRQLLYIVVHIVCCHADYILVSNRIETSCGTFCVYVMDCVSYCDNVLGRGKEQMSVKKEKEQENDKGRS